MYTMATMNLDWDLAFLGEHLIDRIAKWREGLRVAQPPADERLTSLATIGLLHLFAEPLVVPPPPSEVHFE